MALSNFEIYKYTFIVKVSYMEVSHAFSGLRVACARLYPGGQKVGTISLDMVNTILFCQD